MTQTLIVLAIVGIAAAFVGRRAWRAVVAARGAKAGCGGGCDCH
jgi:type II secretory pathway pseudopilin PulG